MFSLEDTRDAIAFQFLIGRLDTQLLRSPGECLSWFQFLIGRLDTWDDLGKESFRTDVSIPHR